MASADDRCAQYRRFAAIDAAFRLGDLDALCAAVDDPAAVPNGNVEALPILLDAGADPSARTRIDLCATPREEAEAAGLGAAARILASAERSKHA